MVFPFVLQKYISFFNNKNSVDYWIWLVTRKINGLFVLQIGANDGFTKDPLNRLISNNKSWEALFVEPVPFLFEKLKIHYPDKNRFRFENSPVNTGKKERFYWVSEDAKYLIPNLPSWYDQLGSFDKSNILKHLNGALKPCILSKRIQGLTLNQLFTKYSIKEIGILKIDTEGHDWVILSQLNLKSIVPLLIIFEVKHLDDKSRIRAIQFLRDDYFLFHFSTDLVCLRKDYQWNKGVLKILRN